MNAKLKQQKQYRIVGIRRDDSRDVLQSGLLREQATELFQTIMNSEEFTAFAVERDAGCISLEQAASAGID